MSRSIVYTTQAAALAAQASIETRIHTFCSSAGYPVDGSGFVSPIAVSGAAMPTGQKTTSWGAVSGSASTWLIPHPEYHTLRRLLVASLGSAYQTYVMQDLGATTLSGTVDTFDPTTEAVAGWQKYSNQTLSTLGGANGTFFDPWVIKVGSVYHLWASHRETHYIAHATSTDGITWTTPVDVLAAASSASVVYKAGTYHMWYTNGDLGTNSQISYATSPDAVTWTIVGFKIMTAGQAWEGSFVSQPVILWDASNSKWRMWYSGNASGGEPISIGYAESSDGSAWTKNVGNPIFSSQSDLLWEGGGGGVTQVGVGTVLFDGSNYTMFYIAYGDAQAQICVAKSADGQTSWTRHPNNPLIRFSTLNASQDRDGVYRPGALLDTDNTWKLYYNGRNTGLSPTETIMLATNPNLSLYW